MISNPLNPLGIRLLLFRLQDKTGASQIQCTEADREQFLANPYFARFLEAIMRDMDFYSQAALSAEDAFKRSEATAKLAALGMLLEIPKRIELSKDSSSPEEIRLVLELLKEHLYGNDRSDFGTADDDNGDD